MFEDNESENEYVKTEENIRVEIVEDEVWKQGGYEEGVERDLENNDAEIKVESETKEFESERVCPQVFYFSDDDNVENNENKESYKSVIENITPRIFREALDKKLQSLNEETRSTLMSSSEFIQTTTPLSEAHGSIVLQNKIDSILCRDLTQSCVGEIKEEKNSGGVETVDSETDNDIISILTESRKTNYESYVKLKEKYPLRYKNDIIDDSSVESEAVTVTVAEPTQKSEAVTVAVAEPTQKSEAVTVAEPEPTHIPKLVFIVPYRDRMEQYKFFSKHMNWILEDMNKQDYRILYIHQKDNRDFNRGSMKNIGFIIVKKLYPNDYKNITLVFNDIDNMPLSPNFFNYHTTKNKVKHFYGFNFALGGIVSINAEDFEKVNGFPNFWAWGYEDNLLQKRVLEARMEIDRNQFYPIFDKNILLLHDGVSRVVNKREFDRYVRMTKEGLNSIHNIKYELNENGFVDVLEFNTGIEPVSSENRNHDLRDGSKPFVNSHAIKRKGVMNMIF